MPPVATGFFARFRRAFAHAFSMEPPPLEPGDQEFLDRLAERIVARRLEAVAIFALEAARPLAGVISAAGTVAAPLAEHAVPLAGRVAPFLRLVETAEEYRRLVRLVERRDVVEALMRKIEERCAP